MTLKRFIHIRRLWRALLPAAKHYGCGEQGEYKERAYDHAADLFFSISSSSSSFYRLLRYGKVSSSLFLTSAGAVPPYTRLLFTLEATETTFLISVFKEVEKPCHSLSVSSSSVRPFFNSST